MPEPKVLILRAAGINRDEDAAAAVRLAGAEPTVAHVNAVVAGSLRLDDFDFLIIPGGFSYGDHLGAGRLLAVDLRHRLGEHLARFVASGRPVLGICNGFQVLVQAGLLPGWEAPAAPAAPPAARQGSITLTDNASGRFECRWVRLAAEPSSACVFTRGIAAPIEVPVAHGEGRLVAASAAVLDELAARGQIALRYAASDDGGEPAYPHNPNGADGHIAGICNAQGTVLGLMPHPENAVLAQQHPRWTREPWRERGDGLAIFENAIAYARAL
jgi:phosphoribosylformylglycinamidine synthase subunit PurQ / glutaminase